MLISFWWEVFHTTSYLINRMPTTTLNNLSPYQKLYNQPPNYQLLRVFGCACYPFLRPYNDHKLDFHSQKYLFLGYSPLHKRYRCLTKSGRVYVVLILFSMNLIFSIQSCSPHLSLLLILYHHTLYLFVSSMTVACIHLLYLLLQQCYELHIHLNNLNKLHTLLVPLQSQIPLTHHHHTFHYIILYPILLLNYNHHLTLSFPPIKWLLEPNLVFSNQRPTLQLPKILNQ